MRCPFCSADEKDGVIKMLNKQHASSKNLLFGSTDTYAMQAAFNPKWEAGVPYTVVLSPDGKMLYISNAWSDNVSVIDTKELQVVQTLPAGFEPSGVVLDTRHNALYVANRLSNDVSVIDLKMGGERKRLLAGRGASYLTLSPDGKLIYCTHIYPNAGAFRSTPRSEITVIDTSTQTVVERKRLDNVAGVFHLATSNDGKLGVVAQLRPKNLIPLAHVEHGFRRRRPESRHSGNHQSHRSPWLEPGDPRRDHSRAGDRSV